MFDVGFAEVFLLGLVGLIVLGPEKLPAVAKTLGGLVRRARSSWYSLRRSIEDEINQADIAGPIRSAAKELGDAGKKVDQLVRSADVPPGAEPPPATRPASQPSDD